MKLNELLKEFRKIETQFAITKVYICAEKYDYSSGTISQTRIFVFKKYGVAITYTWDVMRDAIIEPDKFKVQAVMIDDNGEIKETTSLFAQYIIYNLENKKFGEYVFNLEDISECLTRAEMYLGIDAKKVLSKKEIIDQLQECIKNVFANCQESYGAKSGDILPEQQVLLNTHIDKIADIAIEVAKQNVN